MSNITRQFFNKFKSLPLLCKYNLEKINKPELLYLEKKPYYVSMDKNSVLSIARFIHYHSLNIEWEHNELQTDLYIRDKKENYEMYKYCTFIFNTNNSIYKLYYNLKIISNYEQSNIIKIKMNFEDNKSLNNLQNRSNILFMNICDRLK